MDYGLGWGDGQGDQLTAAILVSAARTIVQGGGQWGTELIDLVGIGYDFEDRVGMSRDSNHIPIGIHHTTVPFPAAPRITFSMANGGDLLIGDVDFDDRIGTVGNAVYITSLGAHKASIPFLVPFQSFPDTGHNLVLNVDLKDAFRITWDAINVAIPSQDATMPEPFMGFKERSASECGDDGL